ncbi:MULTISPECIES: hypothetical protein [Peribacillus]|uniref:Uncharacterized protein n=1 Tax=Peribacillus asahii TaxID=228899 RepID=A0A398B9J7_9BACI|nr:hypothetical protein [Peribacillus asahii]AZV41607.1 hypothetical protein BAOM_0996 [Peribacillus asahii]RID86161.1 hypothetical protein D1953_10335 [Peribacillus asahii]USK60661.1 hypothetical protein LIT37_04885 [Peribacillus asahii]USK71049.1 hypothetical protein LIS76_04620 [Peribacillus asahii]USK85959.1 hypothetical protein LIT35_04765 [Peribacillus asahii]
MVSFWFILFSLIILYNINRMTDSLCVQKEIPEDRQPKVFRTINILITIMLLSSYVEILYT